MGFLDWFKRKPAGDESAGQGPSRALERNIKRLHNKHLQAEERWGAVHALAHDSSDHATEALFKRFDIYVEPSAVDNDEKEYIAEALASRGEDLLGGHLDKALRSVQAVHWVVRIASRVLDRDRLRQALVAVVAEFDTEYERNPERKIELVKTLAELADESVARVIVPFLEDVNETVRFQAVATALATGAEAVVAEPMIAAFLEEESVRVRNAILDGFIERGWSVHGHRAALEPKLPKGLVMDSKGILRRRPKA